MNKDLFSYLNELLGVEWPGVRRLSGGDVSQLYVLTTTDVIHVLKVQEGANAHELLTSEKEGLDFIKSTNTILTPEVRMLDQHDDFSFLLLEYIDARRPESGDFILFGRQLAAYHNYSCDHFGWPRDNFIGSLQQSNEKHDTWSEFYLHERIIPQLRMAADDGRLSPAEIPSAEKWEILLDHLLPDVSPSPLHGDLWSGNFLIRKDGSPVLIDPSIYKGHSEIDLAMSRLFGGFGPAFYESYRAVRKPDPGEVERVEIYQLYYLLVHLNMFGNSYKQAVMRILKKLF